MCRETSTWSWAELGFKEPSLCTQHWTDGTQWPGLLLGQGGVFEGLQQNLPPFTQQHRHRPRDLGRVHTTPAVAHVLSWEEGSSGPGRAGSLVTSCFRSLPVGHTVASEASMAVLLGRTPAAGTDPPGKERLELGAGSSGVYIAHWLLMPLNPAQCPLANGRFKALPPLALLRYDLHVKLVCI